MNLADRVKWALLEDLPQGDVTTDSLDLSQNSGRARLVAKEDLVLSGQKVAADVLRQVDPEIQARWHFQDGQFLLSGQTALSLSGRLTSLLKAERVMLNFLGHLSGIATLTRCFVQQVEHTKAKILDTRKTMPLWRDLEKQAVRHGGGQNHRLNLSAAILLKDNHIRAMGSITAAVARVRKKSDLPIEVETETVEQVEEAVNLRVHRILLDNMSNEIMKSVLGRIPAVIQTEASGNMTIERVRSVADLGVDFISVGALTHSAPSADLSLEFE